MRCMRGCLLLPHATACYSLMLLPALELTAFSLEARLTARPSLSQVAITEAVAGHPGTQLTNQPAHRPLPPSPSPDEFMEAVAGRRASC